MSIDLSEFKTNRALKTERSKNKKFFKYLKSSLLTGARDDTTSKAISKAINQSAAENREAINTKIKQHHATVKLVSQPVNDNKARCAFRKFHKE